MRLLHSLSKPSHTNFDELLWRAKFSSLHTIFCEFKLNAWMVDVVALQCSCWVLTKKKCSKRWQTWPRSVNDIRFRLHVVRREAAGVGFGRLAAHCYNSILEFVSIKWHAHTHRPVYMHIWREGDMDFRQNWHVRCGDNDSGTDGNLRCCHAQMLYHWLESLYHSFSVSLWHKMLEYLWVRA